MESLTIHPCMDEINIDLDKKNIKEGVTKKNRSFLRMSKFGLTRPIEFLTLLKGPRLA